MKVLKFGGSSVGEPSIIREVIRIIKSQDENCVVVVSAFRGITDKIIRMSEIASNGEQGYKEDLHEVKERHLHAVGELIEPDRKASVAAAVTRLIHEMEDLLYGVYLVGDLAPKTRDHLLSFGERLSSYIISNAIENAICLDMRHLIKTNSNHGNAQVEFTETNRNIGEAFMDFSGIAVAPGFIATNDKGQVTTLGRGGSDYTAAIIASAIDASVLEIWTDVDGFMTADPRKVSKAYVIQNLSYAEALELSHFGAKVLYTPTLHPAYKKNIPIIIKNTFNPAAPGTVISKDAGNFNRSPIKGISSIDRIDLITLMGSGLPGTTGISMRLFSALAAENINIILITQASSEFSISFAVQPEDSPLAEKVLRQEFQVEIEYKNIIELNIEKDLSVIAIVGEKMKNTPGISAKLFRSLARNGISVIATAQGSSELNISVVIRNQQLKKGLNSIHEGFFLSQYTDLHLFLTGVGSVGRNLLSQLESQKEKLLRDHNLNIRLIGIANSRKMFLDENGISFSDYMDKLKEGEKTDLKAFLSGIKELNLRNSVFIDCTASEETASLYPQLFEQYVSVVTANKIAAASRLSNYLELKNKSREKGVRFMFETNVGAGLPIINTMNDLIRSGDSILGIEAVLSGTLNYIFNTISDKVSLSEAVRQAKEKGFSEPDPRIDLSGKDVMRKLLILSRESGYMLEEEDISLRPFLPAECFKGSIDDFWNEIRKRDAGFEEKRKLLEKSGRKWRFVARLENGRGSVELVEVDSSHPAYELAASNNIILITTERYREDPMVIRGYGAGAAVTAAGVFADIIRVANV